MANTIYSETISPAAFQGLVGKAQAALGADIEVAADGSCDTSITHEGVTVRLTYSPSSQQFTWQVTAKTGLAHFASESTVESVIRANLEQALASS